MSEDPKTTEGQSKKKRPKKKKFTSLGCVVGGGKRDQTKKPGQGKGGGKKGAHFGRSVLLDVIYSMTRL